MEDHTVVAAVTRVCMALNLIGVSEAFQSVRPWPASIFLSFGLLSSSVNETLVTIRDFG